MRKVTMVLKVVLAGVFTIFIYFSASGISIAKISKEGSDTYCNLCHSGGNSTDGTTNQTCIECHSNENDEPLKVLSYPQGEVKVPIVYNMIEPKNPLPSGNFFWVAQEDDPERDSKGHNIFSDNPDDTYIAAPYHSVGVSCGINSCHENLHAPSVPMNRENCTKCHMLSSSFDDPPIGFHHANDHEHLEGGLVTRADQGWFRFLSGHMGGRGHGVKGYEDGDWQVTSNENDHNEYLAYSGTKTSAGGFSSVGDTITGFCTGCHGNIYISQNGIGNWLTCSGHPCAGDVKISEIEEACLDFPFFETYNPKLPVGRSYLTSPISSVSYLDMLTCSSCHAAHGSPFPYKLRGELFNEGNMEQGIHIDIKPNSCPNPINTKSKGVLPLAILGTEDFDVTQIDLSSIRLEGIKSQRFSFNKDIATPFVGDKENEFDCVSSGPDGYLDLSIKFKTQKVIRNIEKNLGQKLQDGDILLLSLSANLLKEFGGTSIQGSDIVIIRKKGKKEK